MEKNTHTPRPLHLAQAEPLLRERLEATVVLTVTGGSMRRFWPAAVTA